jgi:Na+/H+-translocating membrane pyrophosphatase
MQKVFNILSVAAFLMSAGMLGSSVMLYSRLPGMIIRYADSITDDVAGKVTELIPGQIEQVIPELPAETGLPIPFP